jgi:hypothetical protein
MAAAKPLHPLFRSAWEARHVKIALCLGASFGLTRVEHQDLISFSLTRTVDCYVPAMNI